MEPEEQIERFHEFFQKTLYSELMEAIRKGDCHFFVDFSKLLKFDAELAEMLLDSPEDVLKAAEMAVAKFNLPAEVTRFYVRMHNLPQSQKVIIRDIRSTELNKLLVIEGLVRQKSDVRPRVTSARFECPACGTVITVLQTTTNFKEPTSCSCGRRGKFRQLDRELVDAQGLVIEEIPGSLEGGEQPKRLNVFLKEDLVSPTSERYTNPGSKVRIVGWIKEIQKTLRTGAKSTRFDLVLEGNSIESIEESFYDLEISKKEEKEIKELSKRPDLFKTFVNTMAPSIYGHTPVKQALLFQLVGGVRRKGGMG